MKKEKVKIIELVIHLAVITLLVFLTARPVGAQEKINQTTPATTAAEQQATAAAEKSEYVLPYPGILSDHPLYFLKALRDRIIDFLITDSLKEAEFTLLQSEKRLTMAAALVEKGKPELAESTASKGGEYLARSLSLLDKAKREGKDIAGLTNKLSTSLDKHKEVLLELAEKTSGRVKDRFSEMAANVDKHKAALQNQ